jgi:hypothetical protein
MNASRTSAIFSSAGSQSGSSPKSMRTRKSRKACDCNIAVLYGESWVKERVKDSNRTKHLWISLSEKFRNESKSRFMDSMSWRMIFSKKKELVLEVCRNDNTTCSRVRQNPRA